MEPPRREWRVYPTNTSFRTGCQSHPAPPRTPRARRLEGGAGAGGQRGRCQAIDRTTYETQRDRLREELTLAELAAHEAKIEAFNVEGILDFAEHLVANAGRLWVEGTLAQRQMIQQVIFPEGLPFDGEEVGTGVTCLAFMQLPASNRLENGVASPRGFDRFYRIQGRARKAA